MSPAVRQLLLSSQPAWVLTGAGLDFDFQNGRYFQQGAAGDISSLVTVSRASTAYADDLAGNWSLFSNNVLRVTNKGALIEESRTNSIRNNSMQGAVAGTPGTAPTNWNVNNQTGLTLSLVSIGATLGIDTATYSLSGTASGSLFLIIQFETATQIAASTAQTWTQSAFLSMNNTTGLSFARFELYENTSGGALVASDNSAVSLTPSLSRYSQSPTLSGGGTVAALQPTFKIQFNNAATVNLQFIIGWPQLELGTFATSPIRTTNAAVTRAADVVTATKVPAFGSHSLFAKGTSIAPVGSSFNVILQADQGSNANRSLVYRNTGDGKGSALVTGGGLNSTAGSVIAANTSARLALAAAASDQAYAQNGSIVTTSAAGTIPTPTFIRIGSDSGTTAQWNGYVERIAVWPTTRLADATIARMTT